MGTLRERETIKDVILGRAHEEYVARAKSHPSTIRFDEVSTTEDPLHLTLPKETVVGVEVSTAYNASTAPCEHYLGDTVLTDSLDVELVTDSVTLPGMQPIPVGVVVPATEGIRPASQRMHSAVQAMIRPTGRDSYPRLIAAVDASAAEYDKLQTSFARTFFVGKEDLLKDHGLTLAEVHNVVFYVGLAEAPKRPLHRLRSR